jgi:hypothetical protein
MTIAQNFQNMLNEYLPYELLKNEYMKRDWFLSQVEMVEDWAGGEMQVPFKEASANSIVYGALEADTDIGQSVVVRGTVSGHKFVSSSMIFNHRDLIEHTGSNKISKKSFLKILPDEINDHMQVLREVVSSNLLNGKKVCKLTADATVGGLITVDRPEKLMVGAKIEFHDAVPTTPVTGYVKSIDLSAKTALIVTARGGSTATDLSAFDLVNAPYITHPGANTDAFSGLKDMLLSAANGGVATLYGKTKTDYTYLQSHNESGSSITSTNIIKPIFDTYTNTRRFYKANPNKVVMSFKNFATVMKELEASKGAFNVVPGSRKSNLFGYDQAQIFGVAGGVLDFVACQEMDDDVILLLDMTAMKFHSNGFIRRVKSPEGLEYFVKRSTDGYKYILDHELYGELVLNAPQKCAIIHSISY